MRLCGGLFCGRLCLWRDLSRGGASCGFVIGFENEVKPDHMGDATLFAEELTGAGPGQAAG